jgi:hypothetical protein
MAMKGKMIVRTKTVINNNISYLNTHFMDIIPIRVLHRGPKKMYTHFNIQNICLNNLLVIQI